MFFEAEPFIAQGSLYPSDGNPPAIKRLSRGEAIRVNIKIIHLSVFVS